MRTHIPYIMFSNRDEITQDIMFNHGKPSRCRANVTIIMQVTNRLLQFISCMKDKGYKKPPGIINCRKTRKLLMILRYREQ